jgi:hypothetical protein
MPPKTKQTDINTDINEDLDLHIDEEESEEELESDFSDSECEEDKPNENLEDIQEETKKSQKKKELKESFEDQLKKIDQLKQLIKHTDKDIIEITKQKRQYEKLRSDYERQLYNIFKNLQKVHNDEVNLARKEKKKRKGNINGGFNRESSIPTILCKFLNLPDDTIMSRPKVMSALNNKFTALGLKEGQNTTLNEETVKKLDLDPQFNNKIIKFTHFQAFLASFYTNKFSDFLEKLNT